MAQAEGTSKNDGRVGSSVSGANKSKSSSSSSSSSRTEKDDGRPTSRGISESRSSGFTSSGKSGASNSRPSSKTSDSKSSFGGFLSGLGKSLGTTASNFGRGVSGLASTGKFGLDKATNLSSPRSATTEKSSFGDKLSETLSGFGQGLGKIGDTALKGFGNNINDLAKATASKVNSRDFSGIQNPVARELAATWGRLGWSNKAIAAGLGNAQQESGFRVNARNKGDASDGTDSVGLFQHNSSRLKGLNSYAKRGDPERDIPPDSDVESPTVQASFVDWEMKNTHSKAWDRVNNAADVKEASNAWSRHFEVADPAANTNRAKYSNAFARTIEDLGIEDYSDGISTAISGIENLGKPVGEKPSQFNTDPFGIGTFVADALGLKNPNTGKQKNGQYVDPMVSSVEGRQRRSEEDPDLSEENTTPKRSGVAGIGQKLKGGKGVGAAVDIAGAIQNPVGFALSTILDLGKQSKGMNTPGAEGVGGDFSQNGFGLGFLEGLFTGDSGGGGFAASEKGGGQDIYSTTQGKKGIVAPENAPAASSTDFVPVASLTPPVLVPTRIPFNWSKLT